MNINLPNFNMKNLVKEAGSTISRVVQVNKSMILGGLKMRVGMVWGMVLRGRSGVGQPELKHFR